jgi:secreted trypsin-like serine protease
MQRSNSEMSPDQSLMYNSASLELSAKHAHQAQRKGGEHTNNNDDRIAGGVTAAPNEFPWMAFLELFREFNKVVPPPTDPNVCAGTLINNQWILTSADCLDELVYKNFNFSMAFNHII